MDFFNCITLSEAQCLVKDKLSGLTLESRQVALSEALGRIAAESIICGEDLPPFSRSTVDGFAVRSADTFGAGEGVPALFEITGEIFMGQEAKVRLNPGQTAAIPTGGMLPSGADAVVMLEHTERPDDHTLLTLRAVAPGENIIARGEDVKSGSVIINKGRKISPQDIGVLAACGCVSVPVRLQPVVGIISSGDEVVDAACVPAVGQIRDINSYALAAMLEEMGCIVKRYGIVKDRYQDLLATLSQGVKDCQMLVVSGGSSVGARDHTVRVIEELGKNQALFHGITVKPGKPTIFGIVGTVPVFGLPGHPVAAMTVCRQLVKPAVRILLGQETAKNYSLPARMTRSIASAPGRDDFIRVRLTKQDDGYLAEPVLGKSGLISTMIQADGIVHIPSDKGGLYSGDVVQVELITVD